MARRVGISFAFWVAAASMCAAATHADEVGLARFRHDAFTREEGAPSGVHAIAQTPDGYLWIGARDGLWRFDGNSFEHVEAASANSFAGSGVSSLLVTRDGTLWVGFAQRGGVAVYRHGKLEDARLPDPPPQIVNLVEGPDGAVWAQWGGLTQRLWRYSGRRWEMVDARYRLPAGYPMLMHRSRDGSLWLPLMDPSQAHAGIARLGVGASAFVLKQGDFQYPALREDGAGHLWIADRRRIAMLGDTGATVHYPAPPGIAFPALAFDRWGGLWETTRQVGIVRIAHAARPERDPRGQIERFRTADGLSGDESRDVFIDREGSIWISTQEGIDRFKLAAAGVDARIASAPSISIHMSPGPDGSLHLASGGVLYNIARNGAPKPVQRLTGDAVLCQTPDGALWFTDGPAIYSGAAKARRNEGRLPTHLALGCVRDTRQRLWILGDDQTIWRRDGTVWNRVAQGGDLLIAGSGLAINRAGQIAFSAGPDLLGVVTGEGYRRYRLTPLGLGKIRGIDASGDDFIVAMDRGLARVRQGRLSAFSARSYPWLSGILTSVDTRRGETWLYGIAGVARVSTSDLAAAFDRPGGAIPHRFFDSRDGLPSAFQHPGFVGPQAALTGDGRLWLATSRGVATIDPNLLGADAGTIPVSIRAIAYGSQTLRDPVDPVLPPGTSSIRISYAGLGLADPDQVQFRVRMEGVDPDWVNPGSRRLATYANLGPGTYRFQVIAAGKNGIWNRTGATLHFTIRPTFTQSWYFKALVAILATAALWLAYRLRMRAIAEGVRLRMAERHDERERIARELHDTLLQSINALILHVEAAAGTMPEDAPVRGALESALDRAQDAVVEGRERVEALRAPMAAGRLEDQLRRAADEQFGGRLAWTVEVSGAEQELAPLASNEVMVMAREIFLNTARHAGASRVLVEIAYSPKALSLRFRDDGKGLDSATLRAGFRQGHFGLVGIRERIARLKGQLEIANGSGVEEGLNGLEIGLTLPAAVVFARPRTFWSRMRARLAFGSWTEGAFARSKA